MKVTPLLAEALTNLRGNRDFQVVLQGMAEHEAEELQRCTDFDGTALYRSQGGVKTLQWWRVAFTNAPSLMEKFKQQINHQRENA